VPDRVSQLVAPTDQTGKLCQSGQETGQDWEGVIPGSLLVTKIPAEELEPAGFGAEAVWTVEKPA